jgi:hypothetical protein
MVLNLWSVLLKWQMVAGSNPSNHFYRLPNDLIGYIAGFVATATSAIRAAGIPRQGLAHLRAMANASRRFNRVINENRSRLIQPHLDTIALHERELHERMMNCSDAGGENGNYGSDYD